MANRFADHCWHVEVEYLECGQPVVGLSFAHFPDRVFLIYAGGAEILVHEVKQAAKNVRRLNRHIDHHESELQLETSQNQHTPRPAGESVGTTRRSRVG